MWIYLIHFNRPISPKHSCRHYLGKTVDLPKRIHLHRTGKGSRLCAVAKERDIPFVVVRVWVDEDGSLERKLKKLKNSPKLCPICAKEKYGRTVIVGGGSGGLSEAEIKELQL